MNEGLLVTGAVPHVLHLADGPGAARRERFDEVEGLCDELEGRSEHFGGDAVGAELADLGLEGGEAAGVALARMLIHLRTPRAVPRGTAVRQ